MKTLHGEWAFLPEPLPPNLPISWPLAGLLSDADRAISELAGIGANLPNPRLLMGPFLRREAVLSSRIEGIVTTLPDLMKFEAAGNPLEQPPNIREVNNYVRALEYGLERLSELPVSLRLIREMHELLTDGVRGGDFTPGRFRESQNCIGPPGSTLRTATFVPPPPSEVPQVLDALESYIHGGAELPPLVRIALIHYQFETIHPFHDGNGRVGRLLIALLLCAEGLLPRPLLYLSDYFERNREEYYRRLLRVSQAGEWLEWIQFFLTGVVEQSHDASRRSRRLLDLREEYRERLQAATGSVLMMRIVDELFQTPTFLASRMARQLGVTIASVQRNVDLLVAHDILREVTGQQRNRVWIAWEVMAAIEMPQDAPQAIDRT
jgi:Fic family protein